MLENDDSYYLLPGKFEFIFAKIREKDQLKGT